MARVIRGARRVPADAVAARGEAALVRAAAQAEAERLRAEARGEAEAIRAEARREGRAEGVARAAALLAEARAVRARAAELRERDIAELALAVARRVLCDCREIDPELVARRAVQVVRERFLGPVVVRAHPGAAELVRGALRREAPAAERSVTVREDAALADGVCILEGDAGEVRLDDEEMLERIGRGLAGAGGEEGGAT